jgi:lactoylglutathione lyase
MKAHFKNAWGYQGDNMNLPIEDAEKAVAFYTEIMGFRVEEMLDEPVRRIVLARDDVKIALVENGGDPTQDGCAFQVDNVEAALGEFKTNGLGKELSDIGEETNNNGTWRVFYIVAPDGLCYWIGEKQ